jgi:hypothetical protein
MTKWLFGGEVPALLLAAALARQSGHLAFSGSQPYWQPTTARILGNKAAKALTAVDLPVPRSPNTKTPPMLGSMAVSMMANFMSSWPTMAEKGKVKDIWFNMKVKTGPMTKCQLKKLYKVSI